MEIKRCVRCGNFFTSEYDVCQNCEKKDTQDVNKLKGFLMDGLQLGTTKVDVAHSTGITIKNLNRYLEGKEFKGVNIPDAKLEEKSNKEKNVTNV